jgi:hypothetical protein
MTIASPGSRTREVTPMVVEFASCAGMGIQFEVFGLR